MLNLDSQAFSHLHCDQKVAEDEMCCSLNANLYDGITRFFDNHGYAKAWAEVVGVTYVRYDAYPDEDNGTMEAVPVKKFIAYAIPRRAEIMTNKRREVEQKIAELNESLEFIKYKEQLYRDIQSGKIKYQSTPTK